MERYGHTVNCNGRGTAMIFALIISLSIICKPI